MKNSIAAKTGAMILLTVCGIITAFCTAIVLSMLDCGMYDPAAMLSDYFNNPKMNYYELISFTFKVRYYLIGVMAAGAILCVIFFVFLMCAAGHSKKSEEVCENFIDRIPFDLYTIIVGFSIYALTAIIASAFYDAGTELSLALSVIFACFAIPISVMYFMSCATRIKLGVILKNTLIFKIFKLLFLGLRFLFRSIPFVWRSLLAVLAAGLIFLILTLTMTFNGFFAFFIWALYSLSLCAGVVYLLIMCNRIKVGTKKILDGKLGEKIDTKNMLGELKNYAMTINEIGSGLDKALETKLKSERFRTELITNVSHDIKTPLTSIINYVDLIQKENIENEKVVSYIEVLDRQSRRLKKLTEDIVEASKASTGNISVDMQKLNLSEMLSQSIGEYDEKFAAASLEPVLSLPSESLDIFADGRLTWRVIDNLLNNVCKYSMPNSRVYINAYDAGEKISLSVKNISKNPLNVSPEELMERFVRGDSSRHTEGSGLGLSIARSLCELMKAKFDLYIDGDLFNATVSFDKYGKEQ